MMQEFQIKKTVRDLDSQIQHKIDFKTKPLGALGQLETIAKQICRIQETLSPKLNKPVFVVFAGDHGITAEGVSPFPQEVTYQMVYNFLSGGAAINVFARQNHIQLKIVDCGVNHTFEPSSELIDLKIGYGTQNFKFEPAMSLADCEKAIWNGAKLVETIHLSGTNIIGFGEMGIGNTTSAAALFCKYTQISVNDAVGMGTGLTTEGVAHKMEVIQQAILNHNLTHSPLDVLATFGGYEIATMVGAMLKAAELKMVILLDGFIATSALLAAHAINSDVLDYCIASHLSNENGHRKMLQILGLKPIISLDMRLGEGTGAAIAYPLIESAVRFMNEMSSFENAGVSTSVDVATLA